MALVRTVRQRSDARSNRVRILEVAQTVLADNPDASMEDVAAAAGVVRRTVYAHFSNRDALVEGIATEAAERIADVMSHNTFDAENPARSLARRCLALTEVGERYRLLLHVARRHLGEGGIHDLLGPIREQASEQIAIGQKRGDFSTYLDAAVLASGIESIAVALLDAANDGQVADIGDAIARSALSLLGVHPDESGRLVADIRAEASASVN